MIFLPKLYTNRTTLACIHCIRYLLTEDNYRYCKDKLIYNSYNNWFIYNFNSFCNLGQNALIPRFFLKQTQVWFRKQTLTPTKQSKRWRQMDSGPHRKLWSETPRVSLPLGVSGCGLEFTGDQRWGIYQLFTRPAHKSTHAQTSLNIYPSGGRSSRAILCSIRPHLKGMEIFGLHPGRNMFSGWGPNIFNLGVEDVQGKNPRTWGRFVIAHNEQLIGLFYCLIRKMHFAHCLTGYSLWAVRIRDAQYTLYHISFRTI